MSSSTDSLKKKVCVTVFLDELFEEVLEEERKDLKQVSEITGSDAELSQKSRKGPSPVHLDNSEKVDVFPNVDTEQSQVLLRPRKHRRESKFSKNRYDSFKKQLTKYGYTSCIKPGNECCEPESAVSDSDFDLDDFLDLDKWAAENSRDSFSELSGIDMTEESFLSINPILSTMMMCSSNEEDSSGEKLDAHVDSSALSCSKSTQFDGVNSRDKKTDDRIGGDACFQKEEQKTAEDVLAWKKTEREIQFILTQTKTRQLEEETCEGDRIKTLDLRSILEECVRKKANEASQDSLAHIYVRSNASADVHELSDSYTCVFPHNKLTGGARAPEVKRLWSGAKRCLWNDGFESDFSEADCSHFTNGFDLCSIQNDSLLCYTLCLNCKESIHQKKTTREHGSSVALRSGVDSESTSRESSFENIKSRESHGTDLFFRTVTHLTNKTVLGTILNTEREGDETRNEGNVPMEICKRLPATEGRNKNFAEGDTNEKPLNQDSNFIFDFETREKILLCDEMFLKNVDEAKIMHNNIIVSRAEINLNSQSLMRKIPETENATLPSSSVPSGPTEVLFTQNQAEDAEKNVTDAESEMVFAESENSCDNEVFFGDNYFDRLLSSAGVQGESSRIEIRVDEFEDKLSQSKILRRMKTVEILGETSLREMKNISTEVILICENISDNEVCLEAWQSSASTLRSITEMGQCYLKDSKDSAMYLIEIPLHFTNSSKEKPSESKLFFKASDSD